MGSANYCFSLVPQPKVQIWPRKCIDPTNFTFSNFSPQINDSSTPRTSSSSLDDGSWLGSTALARVEALLTNDESFSEETADLLLEEICYEIMLKCFELFDIPVKSPDTDDVIGNFKMLTIQLDQLLLGKRTGYNSGNILKSHQSQEVQKWRRKLIELKLERDKTAVENIRLESKIDKMDVKTKNELLQKENTDLLEEIKKNITNQRCLETMLTKATMKEKDLVTTNEILTFTNSELIFMNENYVKMLEQQCIQLKESKREAKDLKKRYELEIKN
ncbi:hypothetical protein ZYGR_0AI00940 [Zygosaccharomyces rouxii]|uniref:Uncharacterized protein n=1 Tax=Zygosaccharomyces rouxii TaxID=4956 RepID=A0A1Q3AAS8_ZYGRO|nr:hypothetical protein ZYGR_0AI00940 [Zygosaccharomyces rouxii]